MAELDRCDREARTELLTSWCSSRRSCSPWCCCHSDWWMGRQGDVPWCWLDERRSKLCLWPTRVAGVAGWAASVTASRLAHPRWRCVSIQINFTFHHLTGPTRHTPPSNLHVMIERYRGGNFYIGETMCLDHVIVFLISFSFLFRGFFAHAKIIFNSEFSISKRN